MVAHRDRERVHFENSVQWRAWLDEHHESTDGVWLVSWKTATGKPRISYEESVVEALAVGWVDSMGLTIDDERSMLWFARRKPTSGWSRPNKQRVERLEAEGRMGPGRPSRDRGGQSQRRLDRAGRPRGSGGPR